MIRSIAFSLTAVLMLASCGLMEDEQTTVLISGATQHCITPEKSESLAAARNMFGNGEEFYDFADALKTLTETYSLLPCQSDNWDFAVWECAGGIVTIHSGGFNGSPGSCYYAKETGSFVAWSLFTDGGNTCNNGLTEWWPFALTASECHEVQRYCSTD